MIPRFFESSPCLTTTDPGAATMPAAAAAAASVAPRRAAPTTETASTAARGRVTTTTQPRRAIVVCAGGERISMANVSPPPKKMPTVHHQHHTTITTEPSITTMSGTRQAIRVAGARANHNPEEKRRARGAIDDAARDRSAARGQRGVQAGGTAGGGMVNLARRLCWRGYPKMRRSGM